MREGTIAKQTSVMCKTRVILTRPSNNLGRAESLSTSNVILKAD